MAQINYVKEIDLGGGRVLDFNSGLIYSSERDEYGNVAVPVPASPEEMAAATKYFSSNEYISGKQAAADQAAADNDWAPFNAGNKWMLPGLVMAGAAAGGAFSGGAGAGFGTGEVLGGAESLTGANALPGGAWAGGGAAGATGANGMDLADWFAQDSTGGGWMDTPGANTGGAFTTTPSYDYNAFLNDIGIDPASTQFGSSGMTNAQIMQSIGADPTLLEQLKTTLGQLPPGSQTAAKTALQKLLAGDSMGMSDLVKLGIPAALIGGLFERNTNPLTGNVTQASNSALTSAGAFGGMAPVGMQPSWQKAIDLAGSSAGAWKPYVDKAATYTNAAAGGIPSVDLSKYINPYIAGTLDPALREINLASDAERLRLNHLAAVSGNDTITPGATTPSGYGVQLDLLNKNRMQRIGDTTANAYKGAFDTALTTASSDLNRTGAAGGAFNTLANTVGTQGGADITRLSGAGDLEAKPAQNALDHAADTTKLYTSIIPGTSSAITATNQPSILGQAVGAFGAYNAANKMGIV